MTMMDDDFFLLLFGIGFLKRYLQKAVHHFELSFQKPRRKRKVCAIIA